jgi:hypothetical protein
MPFSTPAEAFAEARKIIDNTVEGPTHATGSLNGS